MKKKAFIFLTLICGVAASCGATRQWFPFRPVSDDLRPNILDCSRWIEAPTGRHGFVTHQTRYN